MARPVADSPEYKGPRYTIEIPDPKKPYGSWILHKVSMNAEDHEEHINRLLEHGIGVYIASPY